MAEELAGRQSWRKDFHDKFVVEERYIEPQDRKQLYLTSVILTVAGLAIFVATLVGVLQHDGLASADVAVHQWLLTTRSDVLTVVMVVLAVIFGPVLLPIIVLVVTVAWGILARHAWRPILLAAAMLTGVGLAQLISRSVERQRPPVDLMLFGADHTYFLSIRTRPGSLRFPAGHHVPDLFPPPKPQSRGDQLRCRRHRRVPGGSEPALPRLSLDE